VIVLCRHGATDANVARAFLSRHDPPLNDLGRRQSERARDALAQIAFQAGFTSPMRRCMQTIEIVAAYLKHTVLDELREIDFGSWEGRTLEWLEHHDPQGVARRRKDPVGFRPSGGENFLDVAQRLRPFADQLSMSSEATLVMAHRGTLGVLERLLRKLPIDSPTVVPLEPGEYRIIT
jgi:alpha-ribazole phosphatase